MGTATGLRISSVDGTAFLDNCPADIIAAVGYQVKIYDASNRYLLGWVKEAGSSETLDTDFLASLDLTSGWSVGGAVVNDSNTFTLTSNYGGVYKNPYMTVGALYKSTFDSSQTAGTTYMSGNNSSPVFASDGQSNIYKTATNALFQIINNTSGAVIDINSASCCKVLSPSASGVTIVNSQGGTTYNFASKDASFTYNAASYSYEIISGHPTTKRFGAVPFCTQRRNIW